MGFFDDSSYGKHKATARACGKCGLLNKCRSPKLPVQGKGRKGILIVAEAPRRLDDSYGEWVDLSTSMGKRLKEFGIDIDEDCWLTGAVVCSPNSQGRPDAEQVRHCRPGLMDFIRDNEPAAIITVGQAACQAVLEEDWGKSADWRPTVWLSECIPSQKLNAWIIPCVDPRDLDGEKDMMLMDLREQLRWVVGATGVRPWTTTPNYTDMVDVYLDPAEAAAAIDRIHKDPRTEYVAIDYETNSLKPEAAGSAIHSVSWSNGFETMAAPWYPEVREASRLLIRDPLPKVACNLKFEERWTIHEFGHGIRNWVWDTMQAAHWLSNRPGITSIKYQSYARLGQPEYDGNMKNYFKTKSAVELNDIRKVPMESLLLYNGMDTLLELLVAYEQIEESGYNQLRIKEPFTNLRPNRIVF